MSVSLNTVVCCLNPSSKDYHAKLETCFVLIHGTGECTTLDLNKLYHEQKKGSDSNVKLWAAY